VQQPLVTVRIPHSSTRTQAAGRCLRRSCSIDLAEQCFACRLPADAGDHPGVLGPFSHLHQRRGLRLLCGRLLLHPVPGRPHAAGCATVFAWVGDASYVVNPLAAQQSPLLIGLAHSFVPSCGPRLGSRFGMCFQLHKWPVVLVRCRRRHHVAVPLSEWGAANRLGRGLQVPLRVPCLPRDVCLQLLLMLPPQCLTSDLFGRWCRETSELSTNQH
jgi:hypothetical protein